MKVNIINSYRNIVAITDASLVGKTFVEGKKILHVKESFYVGEDNKTFSEKEVEEIMRDWVKEDASFNLVGEKTIKIALKIGLISKDAIGRVENVPYALILL